MVDERFPPLPAAPFTMRMLLSFLPAILLGLQLAPSAAVAQSPQEREFLALINEARASLGTDPLRFDSRAQRWAERWTPRMMEVGQPVHQELHPFLGGSIIRAGENVGVSTDGVQGVFEGFMASPPHRANILDPNFTHVGIGTSRGLFQRRDALWTTVVFLRVTR